MATPITRDVDPLNIALCDEAGINPNVATSVRVVGGDSESVTVEYEAVVQISTERFAELLVAHKPAMASTDDLIAAHPHERDLWKQAVADGRTVVSFREWLPGHLATR